MKGNKTHIKNKKEKGVVNKKSILRTIFTSIFNTNLAVALLFILSTSLVAAGDITVKSGDLNVSNDLLVNTNTLFVDSTNNRVGIGIISPAEKLEILGNILLTNGATRTIKINDASAGNDGDNLKISAGTGTAQANGGDLYLFGGDDNNGIEGDVIIAYNGTAARGKVGVGTSAPAEQLDVNGNLKIANSITDGSVSLTVANAKAAYDHISSNGSSHGFLDQNASKGASPQFSTLSVGSTPASSSFPFIFQRTSGTEAKPTFFSNGSNLGLELRSSGTPYIDFSRGATSTYSPDWTWRFIDNSGYSEIALAKLLYISGGNVGIGTTTNVNESLVVNGNVRANSFYTLSDRELKTDIAVLNASNIKEQADVKLYKYKIKSQVPVYDAEHLEVIGYNETLSDERIGLMADEVPKECVKNNAIDLYCMLSLIYVENKELNAQNHQLKSELCQKDSSYSWC